MDIYNNDYYGRSSDDDILAAITEAPAGKTHTGKRDLKMRKAIMKVSKESCPHPTIPANMKECLATFMKVNEQEVWTLWDTGNMTTGITPSFVDVLKITVFPLQNPHILQLGTIGSCVSINYSAYVDVATHGALQQEYVDVVNFNHYDMIIGMPFMHARNGRSCLTVSNH